MARWGNCDFRELQALQKRMEQLQKTDMQRFCEEAAKELAARLLRRVTKLTPVGQYPKKLGKTGGTLRRGWTATRVTKIGNQYRVVVYNSVFYAMYVEYGHRTPNHRGWVPGKFMLTISEKELEAQAPRLIQKKLNLYLQRCLDGK